MLAGIFIKEFDGFFIHISFARVPREIPHIEATVCCEYTGPVQALCSVLCAPTVMVPFSILFPAREKLLPLTLNFVIKLAPLCQATLRLTNVVAMTKHAVFQAYHIQVVQEPIVMFSTIGIVIDKHGLYHVPMLICQCFFEHLPRLNAKIAPLFVANIIIRI